MKKPKQNFVKTLLLILLWFSIAKCYGQGDTPYSIYVGGFASQTNGSIAMMVNPGGQGVVVMGYAMGSANGNQGVFATNFGLTTVVDQYGVTNWNFAINTIQGGELTGQIQSDGMVYGKSANLEDSFEMTETSDNSFLPAPIIDQANAGFYGDTNGDYMLLSADGYIFFYSQSASLNGTDAGLGTINRANSFSANTAPDNLSVTGTLNPSTHVISGSFSSATIPKVNFSLSLITNLFFLDTVPPTNHITSPASGMVVSNSNCLVTGFAGDNVAVSNVLVSLDGINWENATFTSFSNWTAQVTLAAGTNTISAYAMDTSGNVSATQHVEIVYVVTSQLQLQIGGKGTILPNYSNAWLYVGRNYQMTATAASGFAFASWMESTNGTLVYYTNKPAVEFTMFSNLVMQANFVDSLKPSLQITNVKSGMLWSNPLYTVTGLATDDEEMASVNYSLDGAPFTPVATADGWTNWNSALTLAAGTNTFAVYALATNGNVSATQRVEIVYVVTNQLQLLVGGKGTVSPDYSNAWLYLGRGYQMTATAASGFVFTNWMEGTNGTLAYYTNKPVVKFTMFSNLVMQANFVDSLKPWLQITNVKSGMLWSNSSYTVMGRATDDEEMASVNYSLDGAPFTPVTTANGWTNWNAPLTLAAGTNTFAVYAVATNGNVSATQRVEIVYAETNQLQLLVSGKGTVSPNYNNAWLYIGRNYQMTATAAGGFALTNWMESTNGTLVYYTNKPVVEFTMFSNLVMQANFVDVTPPKLTITSPSAGLKFSNQVCTVKGVASDNVAVSNVLVSVNNAGWETATLSNGGSNWAAQLVLTPGLNTISAYAVDTSGNDSKISSVACENISPSGINLYVNPNDPLFMTVLETNGDLTSFFGGKDTNGVVTSLTAMTVSHSGTNTTTLMFDSQGRPSSLFTGEGASVSMSWMTATSFVATYVSANGAVRIQLPVVLTNSDLALLASALTSVPASKQAGSDDLTANTSIPPPSGASLPANYSVVLTLTRCQQPVTDAKVTVTIVNALGGSPLLATSYGNVYIANIPNPYAPSSIATCAQFQQAYSFDCQHIFQAAETWGVDLSDESALCLFINDASTQFPPGTPLFDAFEVGNIICESEGAIGKIGLLNNICNGNLCDVVNNVIDRGNDLLSINNLDIQVEVDTPGSPPQLYYSNQSLSNPTYSFVEDLPPDQSFSLEGPDPPTVQIGDTAAITAVPDCSDSNLDIKWSSSDKSVATVDSSGNVTGVSSGTSEIVATEDINSGIQFTQVFQITVTPPTWTLTSAPANGWTAVASSADGKFLIAAQSGYGGDTNGGYIYTSSDSGSNWQQTAAIPWGYSAIAASADGMTIVAAASGPSIFYSSDGGNTWQTSAITSLSPEGSLCPSIAATSDGTIFLAAINGDLVYGSSLLISTSSGSYFLDLPTYVSLQNGILPPPSLWWNSVACSSSGNIMLAAGESGGPYISPTSGIFISEDSGVTWIGTDLPSISLMESTTIGSVACSGDGTELAASTSGATYVSIDSGNTWNQISNNYNSLVASSDGSTLIGFGQDIYVSSDWGKSWTATGAPFIPVAAACSSDGTKIVAVSATGGIYTLNRH